MTSPNQAPRLFSMGYAPELDASPMIDPLLASYYQSQIVVLIWMVELGRVDINTEVSMLAYCLNLLREGGYSCAKYNTRSALDTSYPDINESPFLQFDWK